MTVRHEFDVVAMEPAAALIFLAKATRYLSRGTLVDVTVADTAMVAEVSAWARWAGHAPLATGGGTSVRIAVRDSRDPEGVRAPEPRERSPQREHLA